MTFERMINSLKNKQEDTDSKEFKAVIAKHFNRKDNQTDIIEEFENDMNKIVEKNENSNKEQ